jgi:hypothetical protein
VLSRTASLRYAPAMLIRAASLALLLFAAACGGSDEKAGNAGTGEVAAKAVADVDAAMADAQRTRTAPPNASAPVQQ